MIVIIAIIVHLLIIIVESKQLYKNSRFKNRLFSGCGGRI